MSINLSNRRRVSSEESRGAALDAARALLVEIGPQAVTLKAVAAKIGRTHANLLHHFGSAAGLQAALAENLAQRVTSRIGESVERVRRGQSDPREAVDLTFDAFDREGAGALAAWMILTGNTDALDPILAALNRLVRQLSVEHEEHGVADTTLWLVLVALGDSLLGSPIAEALGLKRDAARRIATRFLRAAVDSSRPPAV